MVRARKRKKVHPLMYPNTFSGHPAVQVESELVGFLDLLRNEEVTSYLEIGVGRGDTFHEVVSHLPLGSKAVAVDSPESAWGLNGSHDQLIAVSHDLSDDYRIKVIFGDSRDKEIIQKASAFAPFDCVFIDGDHTLQGVTADWENYGKFGKIVAFHDIVDTMRPNQLGEKIEVPLFWAEIKKKYRHIEFVAPGSTMGIGVIFNADARP